MYFRALILTQLCYMFKRRNISIYIGLIFVLTSNIYAQKEHFNKHKIQKLAENYFDNAQFDKALPLYLKLDTLIPDNFEIKYYIGACYLNSAFDKTKGIPYLEYALKHGESYLPNVIFFDLANLYHLNYQFDDAINMLNTFIAKAPKSEILIQKAEHLLQNCKNAKDIKTSASNIDIIKLNTAINSDNSETTPFISADENQLFFTRTFTNQVSGIEFVTSKSIMTSTFANNDWQEAKKINIPNENVKTDISLAGVSPDGEVLFFAIGDETNADLYAGKLTNGQCSKLTKLPDIINSPYAETYISVTPDGRTYYFSSNRSGGYGGKDIYRVTMDDNNQWSVIENLGPSVNTEYDEESPFIHPDNKTLYFSSKGHNNMGGYDIFYSHNLNKNDWEEPTNMGFPINTPGDDLGFVLSAEGNTAYFSSSTNSIQSKQDIYKAILHKTIPLTLVKGTIMGGDPPKPIKTIIRVMDKETQKPLKYIYNPNPKTGKYLMIFPPNKNYDMIIEAEGYLPQLVNIFIPNQTYFYELYQEIFLKSVKVNPHDTAIGQEIRVTNTFYDIYKTDISDSILQHEQEKHQAQVDSLLKKIEDIISTTDSMSVEQLDYLSKQNKTINKDSIFEKRYNKLLNLIDDAIEKSDSSELELLDANAVYNDVTNKVYFYGTKTTESQLTKIVVGNDTLYSLPALNTSTKPLYIKTPSAIPYQPDTSVIVAKKQLDFRNCPENKRRYIYINYIFYPSGKYTVEKKEMPSLTDLAQLALSNTDIGIEINGYADYKGDLQKNIELSKKRALGVAEIFINKQIALRRMLINGKGVEFSEKEMKDVDLQQMRRTEIKLFEIINDTNLK